MAIELSEQEQLRRQSLAALRELGINPYPAARFDVTATAREILDGYDEAKGNFADVRIAGRSMSRRIMGSVSFFELQDHTGRIQVYIRRDDICPEGDPTMYNTVFKKLLDIGDFVGKAANSPPGPAPTTITCGLPSTLLYIVRSYSSSLGISLMYARTFRLTKIVR